MTIHAAVILLGAFCAVALLGVCAAMLFLRMQIRAHDTRERALPMGKQPVAPSFWEGKAAQDRAESASREVVA